MKHAGKIDRIADAYYLVYLLMAVCGFLFFVAQGTIALALVWGRQWLASVPALGGLAVFGATMFLLRDYRNVIWQRHIARLTSGLLSQSRYQSDPTVRKLLMACLISGVCQVPSTQRARIKRTLQAPLQTMLGDLYADTMRLHHETMDAQERLCYPQTSQIDKKMDIDDADINRER